MTKHGRVIDLLGDMAYVAAIRESACGQNCAHCKSNCAKANVKFYAKNKIGAKIGDMVIVFADTKKVVLSILCLYVLPVILIMASVFLGSFLFKSDLATIFLCAVSLILWVAVIKIINKKEIEHTVIKVVNTND